MGRARTACCALDDSGGHEVLSAWMQSGLVLRTRAIASCRPDLSHVTRRSAEDIVVVRGRLGAREKERARECPDSGVERARLVLGN